MEADLSTEPVLIDLFLTDLHKTFGQDDVALPRGLSSQLITPKL